MNSILLFLALVLLAYKAFDTKTALQILVALYLAFLVRRVIQFIALLKTIKQIKCDYYLLTPWRSTLWLILPHIKYITPPVSVPVNDAVKLRQRYEKAGGARIVGLATVFSPQVTLYIADSKAIKAIVADRAAFPKPLELYRALAPYGENITITGGDEWRKHRRIVGPAFCEETYALGWENSVSITKDWIRHLDERIKNEASKEGLVIEKGFKQTSLQLALGVFTTTAFGYPISTPGQKADPVPPGHQYTLKDTLEGAVDYMNLFTTVATPTWLSWFPYGKIRRAMDLKKELDMWLGEIIEERKKALQMGEEKKDLLYNLIKANELEREQQEKEGLERSSAQALTPQELNGNLFIFLLAGHETGRI